MKKLLSLLAMLMITVMAFATDYKGQLDYAIKIYSNSYPASIAEGTLSITQYDNGNYQVTAKDCNIPDIGNFGNVVCDGLSGTTDANGVTTIDVTDCTAGLDASSGWTDLSSTKLLVKFKGDKAYATFEGKYQVGVWRTVSYTFGTDDFGGGSTGGGETGGETSSIVTVKENFQSTEGSSWGENVTIDWNTQKLVASINLASTGSDKGFLGVTKKGQTAGWNNYGIIFYNTNGSTVQGYAPGQPNNANTNQVTKGEDPVRFEISKEGGVKCQGNVVISASNIAHLTNQSEIVVGAADKPAGALYNYIKVVPLDWTEVPPVTVAETFTYDQDAFVGPNDTKGTANVKVYKMTDDSYTMEITAPVATKVGVITVGEDAKGRTTYMGEVESSVVSGVKYVVNGVVYEEGGAKHLYMTLIHDDDTYIIGENPDAPKVVSTLPFENVAYTTSYNGQGTANVTFTEMSDGTFPMTFVSDGLNVNAENLTKGEDAKGRTTYTGTAKRTDVDVTFTVKAVVYGEAAAQKLYMTMDNGAGFVVTVGEDPDYVAPVTYKNTLKVVRGTDTKTYEDAEVSVLAKGENKYAVTIPSFTDMDAGEMEGTIGKLTFEATGVEDGGTLKLTATSAATTQDGGNGWDNAGFTASMDATVTDGTLAGTFTVVYPQDVTNYTYTLYYGVAAPDVITEKSNKTYTSNLRILDGETTVVEEAEANVNIVKYSDESYKVTLKNVNMLNKTQDLVFVGKGLVEEAPTEATEPLTIIAKSDEATTAVFGEQVSGTFEITEVSADEIKMGFSMESQNFSYQGEFNYTEEEEPEVYTNNLHIYDAAAPETDLFQADQAKVEFLATATGEFKLTLKDVTLNEKKSDLVFTGALPTPQPGGQDPLAEEGEGEVTPAEPAMVLNATADEATATFLGTTSAKAVFNVIMNDEAETENDAFALTFTITAGDKNYAGEFNYEKKDPVEEYPVNFDKTAKSTHSSRALNSFSLQQTGKDKQTESVYASKAAYEDHTSKVFTVEAGSELTASFDYTGEWMHSFVYIDFDNDGDFSYKEGQWDQTGTDLVAFSFYSLDSNPKNDASGYNSVGDELTGDARNTYAAPSFKAPAKAGEYRIRFKFDWNCILPGGSSSILSDGGGVWDATLKVVEPVVDGISSINAEVANGEAQLFTIDGVKLNKLQKGLNIVRTADGKVKKVLVK